eukprot:7350785-Ditylum_brightwellii.AAC.1
MCNTGQRPSPPKTGVAQKGVKRELHTGLLGGSPSAWPPLCLRHVQPSSEWPRARHEHRGINALTYP